VARESSAVLNAAPQATYFIIGVRAAGLARTMTGTDLEVMRKEFLDDDHTPLMVVNIGRPGPDAWYPRSPAWSSTRS
jgi:3-hydroxypropanoate dehydrogenase